MDNARAVADQLSAAVLAGEFDQALLLISPDAVDHAPLPGAPSGRDGWRQKWEAMGAQASEVVISPEQRVADGDTIATRYTIRSAATGEPIGYALDMIRVADGLLVEHWALPLP